MTRPIAPGNALGVLGGGQLGRMFAQAAQRLGFRVVVVTDEPDSPAAAVADSAIVTPNYDLTALRNFATQVCAATIEFENVPAHALRWLARKRPTNPGWHAVWIAQHRIREKSFLTSIGAPVAPWQPIRNQDELQLASQKLNSPRILKTAALGYDGKGQFRVESPSQLRDAWHECGAAPCVLEDVVSFAVEASCLIARGYDGACALYPVFWNQHRNHILDVTLCPAPLGPMICREIQSITRNIAEALGVVGLLTAEFFITDQGAPIVNELAPRPHNSAHLTIEASTTSQFEQQVRALAGLPLGNTEIHTPAAMVNLLGECWSGGEPAWDRALALDPAAHLHLYGKKLPSPGRKMGHITVLDRDLEQARLRALAARHALQGR